jgi:hypothetical protein
MGSLPDTESGGCPAFVLLSLCRRERAGLSRLARASAAECGCGSDSTAAVWPQTRRTSDQTIGAAQPHHSARVASLVGQALYFFSVTAYERCCALKRRAACVARTGAKSPLECPITIYGGIEDHEVEAERLAAWSEMTVGNCEIRIFLGGHFYINSSHATFLRTFAGDLLRLCPQS